MSYGHYPQAQQQQQQHYQPPHQGYGGGGGYGMPPHHDPFRAWYASKLAELTFNSRPIIQNLSVQAVYKRDEGDWAGMQGITEEIEQAVLRAPPQGKLPLLYLIDSISKNAGQPYTDQLFPTFLGKLYLKTYREVDGVTKSKMEEMLKLWRTGGPYGAELYPATMREEVERQIIGTSAVLTQPQVQANLRQFLKEKEAEMANEFSTSRAKTVNVLVQIDQLLSSSQVSPKELADISEKVRAMKAGLEPKSSQLTRLQTAAGGAGATGGASPQPGSAQPRSGFPNQPPTAFAQQQQPPPPQPQPQQQLPFRNPGGQSPFPPFPAHGNQQTAPVAAPAAIPAIPALSAVSAIPMNVADILRNLNNSGVLSAPRTPEPTKPKSGLDNYEEMILALDIRVDFLDPNRLALPVTHLPVRCKQCGLRFPDGENKLQAHMDWHFRRNRKERETEGRGAHRRWLPRAEEWINENVQGGGPSSPNKADTALPAKLSAEMEATLKHKMVRAPSDPVKAKVPCPICKEQFKSEWNEDEEEWVFMNAVEVGNQIYHAVCRAEATLSAKKNRLLAKERAESRSPAPSLPDESFKRKASPEPDTDDASKRVKVEAEESQARSHEAVEADDPMQGTDATTTAAEAATAETAAEPEAEVNVAVKTEPAAPVPAVSVPVPVPAPAPAIHIPDLGPALALANALAALGPVLSRPPSQPAEDVAVKSEPGAGAGA